MDDIIAGIRQDAIVASTSALRCGEVEGACTQCGLCCKENWRFQYELNYTDNTITGAYRSEPDVNYEPCEAYDPVTRKCNLHGKNKPDACKYWPILPSDLEQVNCPGFKVREVD